MAEHKKGIKLCGGWVLKGADEIGGAKKRF